MLKWLSVAGLLLINILLGIFGTAVVESPIYVLWPVHTLPAILLRGYLLSAICACFLGYLVYRRWQAAPAKWIWAIGIGWLGFRAILLLAAEPTSVWSSFSGSGCRDGLHAISCMNWFVFTMPALRLVAYSAGAILCSNLKHNGPSLIEDAWLGRFRSLNIPQPLPDADTDHDRA
jgi:hypothetical protein